MIAEQEELDWEVYHNYGLIEEELFLPVGETPEIALWRSGHSRSLWPAVSVLARLETEWFTRNTAPPRSPNSQTLAC